LLGEGSGGCFRLKGLLLSGICGSLGNFVISGLKGGKLCSSFLSSDSLELNFSIESSLLFIFLSLQ
jgi:hypothetical protein